MRMPFGKYKGKDLEDIPVDYLQWAAEWLEEKGSRADLVVEMENQIRLRAGHGVVREQGKW